MELTWQMVDGVLVPNVHYTLIGFTALFLGLGIVVVALLRNLVRSSLPKGHR